MSDLNENEKKLLLDHDYDGIQEFDYPLPFWWLCTFWGAIIFGIGYFYYYQIAKGPTLRDEYKEELTYHKKIRDGYLETLAEFDVDRFNSVANLPDMVNFGKQIYNVNCIGCHAVNGAGEIGPNLSDKYWLYADGTGETIFPFLIEGNPAGGMPAWGEYLEEDELYAVTAYVVSLKGFKHEGKFKAPQGEPVEEEAVEEQE